MNEKIKEFAELSGFMVGGMFAEDTDISEAFEKFAKLIANECAKICVNEMYLR